MGRDKIRSLIIDDEFSSLIPKLKVEEYLALEDSVLSEGLREPILVWDGIIIDGHNRYRICQDNGIEIRIQDIEFMSREQAKIWIIKNQLARRNLNDYQRSALRLKQKAVFADKAKENQGTRTDILTTLSKSIEPVNTRQEIAELAGVSEGTMAKVGKIEKEATPEQKERLEKGEASINQVYTEIRREEKEQARERCRQQNQDMIDKAPDIQSMQGKFSTILIDPPWDWGDEGDIDQFGRAKPTYQTISMGRLLELPVGDLADLDCHLYLWITNRSLPKGFGLIEKWGFRYITCLTWCKPSIGMGNYFRGSSEHILFAVKGSQPLKRRDMGTWFDADRGQNGHSSKPEMIYDLIESCSPGPYLEIFARSKRQDWITWGAEVGNTV